MNMENIKLWSRSFTFLVLGQASSLFGNFILKLAMSMYILEATGSAAVFGGLLAVSTVPMVLLSPFGGILADRANRRNIMVGLDCLNGLTVVCAMLFFSQQGALTVIAATLIVLSVLGAFETPTVQACVPQMQSGDNIVKANAVISQVQAIAGLGAPILGSVLYAAFGLQRLLPVCAACFFLTAFFECFIRLPYTKQPAEGGILKMVKGDFSTSIRFITREQKGILRFLLVAAGLNFLLTGVGIVGMPYLVRTVMGLSATHYGVAESLMGFAAIVGALAAGVLATRVKTRNYYRLLIGIGVSLLPCGAVLLLSGAVPLQYGVLLGCSFVMQVLSMLVNVFVISLIQQKTPAEMLGKVMAYVGSLCMCAQPLGQVFYGFVLSPQPVTLFLIFILSGLGCCAVSLATKKTFREMDGNTAPAPAGAPAA